MAVPDTTTFTLQNVVDEVNPTTDDLVDCFADAVVSKFDSAYSSSVGLLKFRNYGAVTISSFLSGSGQTDAKFICSQGVDTTKYFNGSGSNPAVGDTVYENSNASTTTGNGFYTVGTEVPANQSGFYRITGGSGVVSSTAPCNP